MRPQRVFISYAHEDEKFRDELQVHLRLLERQGLVECWHDRKILAGTEWNLEISENLQRADVILLLISPDFINSDYCYDVEMKVALDSHKSHKSIVIPILIRPVANWEKTDFAALQVLPNGAKPVTSWDSRDSAWADVAAGIIRTIQRNEENQRPHLPNEEVNLGDIVANFTSNKDMLDTGAPKIDQATIDGLSSNHPKIAESFRSYFSEMASYYRAAQKVHEKILSLLQDNKSRDIILLRILELLSEQGFQYVRLNVQLVSLVTRVEEAGLSCDDYGLPSIEIAAQQLKTKVESHAELTSALGKIYQLNVDPGFNNQE